MYTHESSVLQLFVFLHGQYPSSRSFARVFEQVSSLCGLEVFGSNVPSSVAARALSTPSEIDMVPRMGLASLGAAILVRCMQGSLGLTYSFFACMALHLGASLRLQQMRKIPISRSLRGLSDGGVSSLQTKWFQVVPSQVLDQSITLFTQSFTKGKSKGQLTTFSSISIYASCPRTSNLKNK
jgi:hypothetical protein